MYKTSLCFHQLNYKTKTFEWWRQLKVQTMSLQHLHVHNKHRQSSNHNTSTKTQVTTSSQSITFKAHITFTFVSYVRSQCLYMVTGVEIKSIHFSSQLLSLQISHQSHTLSNPVTVFNVDSSTNVSISSFGRSPVGVWSASGRLRLASTRRRPSLVSAPTFSVSGYSFRRRRKRVDDRLRTRQYGCRCNT